MSGLRGWRRGLLIFLALCLGIAVPSQAIAEDVNVQIGVGETTVRATGLTSPGALVTIMDSGSVIGSAVADGSGEFVRVLTDQTPGIHTYDFFAQDTAGRFSDTISVVVNVIEHAQTDLAVFLPPIVRILQPQVIEGEKVTIEGSTAPDASVVIYIDNDYVTANANSSGVWSYVLDTSGMAAGQHSVYAIASKSGSGQSHASAPRSFVVQAVPTGEEPALPPAEAPTPENPAPQPPVITSPKPGEVITGDTVEVIGTATPGAQIEVWNRGQIVGSTFADKDGKWRLLITLDEFANSLTARACINGVCSEQSAALQFFRQPPPLSGPTVRLDLYRFRVYVGDPLTITATIRGGTIPYQIAVDWGDGTVDMFTSSSLRLPFTHRYKTPGKYKGSVTVTDKHGKTAAAYFSVEAIPKSESWLTPRRVGTVVVVSSAVILVTVLFEHKYRFRIRLHKILKIGKP